MHILFSSKNPASSNMAGELIRNWFSEKGEDCWECGKHILIDTKVEMILDVPTDFEAEGIVVLSTHRSEKEYPTLTVHVPGNWNAALMGGEPRTLNTVMAGRMKNVLKGLQAGNEKHALGWNVNMEVDHHGPTCPVPIMFVEIGSGEKEWGHPVAGKIGAGAVMDMLESSEEHEAYFCVGGGHYSQKFTRMGLLDEKRAAGHILPKYQIAHLEMDTFRQAMEKSVEKTQGILMEKKGTNKEQKELVGKLAKEYGAEIEFVK